MQKKMKRWKTSLKASKLRQFETTTHPLTKWINGVECIAGRRNDHKCKKLIKVLADFSPSAGTIFCLCKLGLVQMLQEMGKMYRITSSIFKQTTYYFVPKSFFHVYKQCSRTNIVLKKLGNIKMKVRVKCGSWNKHIYILDKRFVYENHEIFHTRNENKSE